MLRHRIGDLTANDVAQVRKNCKRPPRIEAEFYVRSAYGPGKDRSLAREKSLASSSFGWLRQTELGLRRVGP